MLIAPLLDDPVKRMQLTDLYNMLTSNQLCEILKSENIEDEVMASLRLSVHVSVQMIEETDPECLKLFLLLGFLPGGIRDDELEAIRELIGKIQGEKELNTFKRSESITNDSEGNFKSGRRKASD